MTIYIDSLLSEYDNSVNTNLILMSSKIMETRYYEGCGREGPIRCIFLGEFHPVAGPKISCQVSFPCNFVVYKYFKNLIQSICLYVFNRSYSEKNIC